MAKYFVEGTVVYANIQSAINNPATIAAANAVSSIEPNFNLERPTTTFQYSGDINSREQKTVETDRFGTLTFRTLMQVIGTMPTGGATLPASSVPLRTLFRMSGCSVILGAGVDNAASVTITNSPKAAELGTLQYRSVTADIPTQKTIEFTNAQATVDLNVNIGTTPELTFNIQGSIGDAVERVAINPVFSDRSNPAAVINDRTLVTAEIVDWNNGSPVFTGNTNFCFSTLSHPNMFGYELTRLLNSCESGTINRNVPSDITVTIFEDQAGVSTIFDALPQLGTFKAVRLSWSPTGNAAPGRNVVINYSKVEVASVSNTPIGNFKGQTVVLSSLETTSITFS